ncbi:MAG: BamA/TamA family outer membrane protein [Candidatus Neomarinimicrobiota bacterium]
MKKIIFALTVITVFSGLNLKAAEPRFVSSVSFAGNTELSSSLLIKQINQKKPVFWRTLQFDRRLLKLDAINLKNFYVSKGFLAASVSDSFSFNEENVHVFFRINEGPKFYLKQVNISGNTVLKTNSIIKILDLKSGSPFNPILMNKNLALVEDKFHHAGKLFMQIKPEVIIQDSVNVEIKINEGSDVYIGDLFIRGHHRVNKDYISRELKFKNGDLFDNYDLSKSQKILLETGFFSSVNIIPQVVPGSDSTVNILVNVKEFEKRGEISLEPGYFDVEWNEGINRILGFGGYLQWLDRMAFGSYTRFQSRLAAVMPTEEGLRYPRFNLEIKLNSQRPRIFQFLPFRLPMQLKIFYQQFKNYGDESGPYIRRFGFKYSNIFRIKNRSFIETGLRWELFNEDDSSHTSTEQRKLSLEIQLDERDNPVYPQKGNIFILKINSSGGVLGGSRSFTKVEIDFRQYFKIINKVTLAARINAGKILDWNDNYDKFESVLFEKFYLGGSNTLRAWKPLRFEENEFTKLPEGREIKVLTNWEIRFPLIWKLGGTAFIDGGMIDNDLVSRDLFSFNQGLGLTMNTPFGPIRLDYARAIENPDIWQVHFGFLYAF